MVFDTLTLLPQEVIAVVGAGGKTTLIWRLLHEAITHAQRVVLAPTARTLEPILPRNASLYLAEQPVAQRIASLLMETDCVIVAARREQPVDGDISAAWPPARPIKLRGLLPAPIDDLIPHVPPAIWISEADGAARHLTKAPAAHEPPIPMRTTTVIQVVAVEAIGQPLDAAIVHRPEIFAALAGLAPGEIITPEALSRVLLHPQGGLKNIPDHARTLVLLTQRDPHALQPAAQELIERLCVSRRLDRVVVAALRPEPPVILHTARCAPRVAGVVLAAGAATRFNSQPKQLLDWGGRTLVEITVDRALAAELDPVVVVVGAQADRVRDMLRQSPVTVIDNAEWARGQSTSVKAGLRSLPAEIEAAIFMPIDQPLLSPHVLRALGNTYLATQQPIVAASVNGQRTTPVLFHRSLFNDILGIDGDRGARQIIAADPSRVANVEIDAEQAIDIDTPDVYNELYARLSTSKFSPTG